MAACVDCASPGDDQPATFLGTVVSESWRSDRMLFSFLFRNIFCSTKVRRFFFQQDFLLSGFENSLGDGANIGEVFRLSEIQPKTSPSPLTTMATIASIGEFRSGSAFFRDDVSNKSENTKII